jgi:hypothetical protein
MVAGLFDTSAAGAGVAPGEAESWFDSSLLIQWSVSISSDRDDDEEMSTHRSSSFLSAVFFLFGVGILHSMPNAVQFVHGTPRLAASHRTYSSAV